MPTLILRGASFARPYRRATLVGRITWGVLGFMAASFLTALLVMWQGRTVWTDLLPLAGLLTGACVIAPRRGPLVRRPVREVLLGLGHEGLRLLLTPADHETLVRALEDWHQRERDHLIRYQTDRRVSEFRVSDVRAHTVIDY